jgi:hypothetical protein
MMLYGLYNFNYISLLFRFKIIEQKNPEKLHLDV